MSDVASKWGERVAGRGFAQIPNYLLLINQFLQTDKRLAPAELNVLLQLVGAWWKKDELPFPALKTLAVRAGVSDRQAQRAVTRLEQVGLIKRVKRSDRGMIASNAYDLKPLVTFLDAVAKAFPNEFVRKAQKDKISELDMVLQSESGTVAVETKEHQKPAKPVRKRLKIHQPALS